MEEVVSSNLTRSTKRFEDLPSPRITSLTSNLSPELRHMWILQSGVCRIVQRNWRDDIDDPKSTTRKRPLTLGYLVERYRLQSRGGTRAPGEVGLHTDGRQRPPAVGFRRPASSSGRRRPRAATSLALVR